MSRVASKQVQQRLNRHDFTRPDSSKFLVGLPDDQATIAEVAYQGGNSGSASFVSWQAKETSYPTGLRSGDVLPTQTLLDLSAGSCPSAALQTVWPQP